MSYRSLPGALARPAVAGDRYPAELRHRRVSSTCPGGDFIFSCRRRPMQAAVQRTAFTDISDSGAGCLKIRIAPVLR